MSASSRPPDHTGRDTSEGRHQKASVSHKAPPTGGGTVLSSRVNPASSSSTSAYRRQSLFGTEDRIVLEIGSRMSKIGFSGEARPREVFYTLDEIDGAGSSIAPSAEGLLWTTDFLRCNTDEERSLIQLQLRSRIIVLLRDIFFRRLMVDPKQRKLIIIEGALMPTLVKQTLIDVLFGNLQVPSVSFVPSHILCALSIGSLTSIVLDVGYQEATIVPVHYGRALVHPHLMSTPRAGKRLALRLRALLLHFATYIPNPANSNSTNSSGPTGALTQSIHKVPLEALTWTYLDEIIAKTLFVADRGPQAKQDGAIEDALQPRPDNSLDWKSRKPFSALDEAGEEAVMRMLERKYKGPTSTKDITMSLPCPSDVSVLSATQPATLGAPVALHSHLKGSIIVPGWVRERAAEVLLEDHDEDELSLVEMVLQTLAKLPVDMRKTLAGRIFLVGGTAMLPGLAERLRKEVVERLEDAGAPLRGQSDEQARKSRSGKHQYRPISQLAAFIRFSNEQDSPVANFCPTFAFNLSSWIGGSLMGSLHVESVDQKFRETWDLEKEELAASKKAAAGEGNKRPGIGTGRGSFLGTVTGLDLGTYGPLSAHSRGAFNSTSTGSGTSPRSPKVA